ncbi:MAG: sensor histidine kinase, partial [Saccharofermentanales bacterium]
LGFISMPAQAAKNGVEAGNAVKAEPILSRLTEVAQEAHTDVRESILSLRTGMAEEWTFMHALQKYLHHYQTSFGVDIELQLPEHLSEDALDTLHPDVGVQVMRVIQEALTNASKHGGAQRVNVQFVKEDGRFNIRIADNGCGFDPARLNPEAGKHFGLMIMRERMTQVGGSIIIESQPGSGTTIVLDVPSGI